MIRFNVMERCRQGVGLGALGFGFGVLLWQVAWLGHCVSDVSHPTDTMGTQIHNPVR